jgi:hypothetical protein
VMTCAAPAPLHRPARGSTQEDVERLRSPAPEPGCEECCERGVDEVEYQGVEGCICILVSGETAHRAVHPLALAAEATFRSRSDAHGIQAGTRPRS